MVSESFCVRYLLMLLFVGFLVHVSGILFIVDGSVYATISNLTLFLPVLIVLAIDSQSRKLIFDKKYLPLVCFLVFTVFISIVNDASENSIFRQFKICMYVFLYVSSIALLDRCGAMEKCLNVAFIIASVFAIASIVYQSHLQSRNIFLGGYRIFSMGYGDYGNFKNPIISALYYGFFGVYGFSQLLIKRHTTGIAGAFIIGMFVLSIYLFYTFSRGVWLGYCVALAIVVIFHYNARSKILLAIMAALFFPVLLWIIPVFLNQRSRGFSLRDEIWGDWYSRLNDFWLLGAGADTAFNVCLVNQSCFKQAHNLFLQVFFEYGFLGFLLIILMIFYAFFRASDRRLWTSPLGAVGLPLLVFGVVTAIFDYHTVLSRPGVYWIVFWLPIGLVLSASPKADLKS